MTNGPEILWHDRKRTFLGLPFSFTRYSLSEDRLFIETGFWNKKEDEVRLYRITDVSLMRTFGQRLLGLGTIHCCSADKTMQDFNILNIKRPKAVKELLSQLVEAERVAKRVTNSEFLGHQNGQEMDDIHDNDPVHEHEAPDHP